MLTSGEWAMIEKWQYFHIKRAYSRGWSNKFSIQAQPSSLATIDCDSEIRIDVNMQGLGMLDVHRVQLVMPVMIVIQFGFLG